MIAIDLSFGGVVSIFIEKKGIIRKITSKKPNLILSNGLNSIPISKNYLDFCFVGTGNTVPDFNKTQLVNYTATCTSRSAANSYSTLTPPYLASSTITYVFNPGTIPGGIVREIGFGSTPTNLFSRVLPRDNENVITELNILNDETLIIQYELINTITDADVLSSFSIGAQVYNCVLRPAFITNPALWAFYNSGSYASTGQATQAVFATAGGTHCKAYEGGLNTIFNEPFGTSASCSAVTNTPYVTNSYKLNSAITWTDTIANFPAGVRSFLISMMTPTGSGGNSLGCYQFEISPPIAKTSSFKLTLNVEWRWRSVNVT